MTKILISTAMIFLVGCSLSIDSGASAQEPNSEMIGSESIKDFSVLGQISLFQDISIPMGQVVDSQYRNNELLKVRGFNKTFEVDKCDRRVQGQDRFADRIAFGVFRKMKLAVVDLGAGVPGLFGMSSDLNTLTPVSLMSHAFCPVSASSLQVTFDGRNVPSAGTIAKAQKLTELLNQFRNETLQGSLDSKVKAYKLWSKFMMCLAYTESLTTADVDSSKKIAEQMGFERPEGVSFYNDSLQTNPDSILNIGLYQFSTVVNGGNTYSCVDDWNRQNPSCSIDTNISRKNSLNILASTYQSFNAFCGASMIARMFQVQVNTSRAKNTHPNNILNDGSLKPADERCVSPFMNVNRSYNHFGPLQNTTRNNLDQVLSCALSE